MFRHLILRVLLLCAVGAQMKGLGMPNGCLLFAVTGES